MKKFFCFAPVVLIVLTLTIALNLNGDNTKPPVVNESDITSFCEDNAELLCEVSVDILDLCKQYDIDVITFSNQDSELKLMAQSKNSEEISGNVAIDEHLENKIFNCFSEIDEIISDEYAKEEYAVSIHVSERFDYGLVVDFGVHDTNLSVDYGVLYSEEDLTGSSSSLVLVKENLYQYSFGRV